jgi:hypothetical protein
VRDDRPDIFPARTSSRTAISFVAVLLSALAPAAALAQRVELSSPLDGNARAGRAAAVRVVADGLGGPALTLGEPADGTGGGWAAGVVPVRLPVTGGRVDAVVPLLFAGDPLAALGWSDGRSAGTATLAVRPLGIDDRLVAVAGDPGDAAALAADLFPAKRPVVVPLDTSRPRLLVPAAAYEAVDALLLDAAAAARMDEGQLRTLLAGGTVVAVRAAGDGPAASTSASPFASAEPVPGWPWARRGDWWVLRHEVAGPRGGVNPDVYLPTYSWDRSWPPATRRAAALAAAAAGLAVLAACLWRSRWSAALAVGVCAAAGVAAAAYGASLSPVATAAGDVVAWDGRLAQRDRWQYVSAIRDATTSVAAADGLTKPALGTRRPLSGLTVTLTCAADGSPDRYELTLPAKATVAFLSRSVGPEGPPASAAPPAPLTVPIGLFADRLYPGTVAGQTEDRPADAPTGGAWWGTAVMRR